jgi:hypothetical protein
MGGFRLFGEFHGLHSNTTRHTSSPLNTFPLHSPAL